MMITVFDNGWWWIKLLYRSSAYCSINTRSTSHGPTYGSKFQRAWEEMSSKDTVVLVFLLVRHWSVKEESHWCHWLVTNSVEEGDIVKLIKVQLKRKKRRREREKSRILDCHLTFFHWMPVTLPQISIQIHQTCYSKYHFQTYWHWQRSLFNNHKDCSWTSLCIHEPYF